MTVLSRTSAHIRTLLAAAIVLSGSAAQAARPTVGKAPIVIQAPKSLDAAVAAIEKATGAKAEPVELGGKKLSAAEGRTFALESTFATRLLAGSHAEFRKAGLYLFRHERSFGMGDAHDHVVVLAMNDRDAIVKLVGTRDAAKKLTTDQIVAFLGALDKDEPFDLDEIGDDYVAGRFKAVPKDPAGVAKRLADFAPELVKGGKANALELLANEIRTNRTLYLIW